MVAIICHRKKPAIHPKAIFAFRDRANELLKGVIRNLNNIAIMPTSIIVRKRKILGISYTVSAIGRKKEGRIRKIEQRRSVLKLMLVVFFVFIICDKKRRERYLLAFNNSTK